MAVVGCYWGDVWIVWVDVDVDVPGLHQEKIPRYERIEDRPNRV